MQIECYAQRLLNPFRGVVHTIRYQSAEAVTTDGVEWDIYVANDARRPGARRATRTDFRHPLRPLVGGKRPEKRHAFSLKRFQAAGRHGRRGLRTPTQKATRGALHQSRPVRTLAARPARPA